VKTIQRIALILFLFHFIIGCTNTIRLPADGAESQKQGGINGQIPDFHGDTEILVQPGEDVASKPRLYIADEIQSSYRDQLFKREDLEITTEKENSDIRIEIYQEKKHESQDVNLVEWLYVAAVPFQYPADAIESWDIQRAWQGMRFQQFDFQPLLVSQETAAYFASKWGPANRKSVKIYAAEKLLEAALEYPGAWALLPFEQVTPAWRILSVGGQFPLSRTLDRQSYPLIARYLIHSDSAVIPAESLWETNLDSKEMTSLLLTGTTAFVRNLAFQIEKEGMAFAIEAIQPVFMESDLSHLSNEVPMFADCPPAVPLRVEMRFCSDPSYIRLFTQLDVSFVELSGNHQMDWWEEPFLETLALYTSHNLPTVGGGRNLEEALKPLELEDHGNRFVFFSCNAVGPEENIALEDRAGSAPCNVEKLMLDIADYRAKGFLPIVLLQHIEVDTITPHSLQRIEFAQLAQAGAVIVSGSQAHRPQTYAFYQDSLLHYGLGNTFFDQTRAPYHYGIMDRHYFYRSKYITTEILPVEITEDFQTIMMSPAKRPAFLAEILGEME
jgi:poly-gamma-glutamate synthesis protein (capsule biosynthesis protein)